VSVLARIALVVALGASACAPVRASTIAVVSAKSPIASLSKEQLANVFLGRVTQLPGGISVMPIDQAEGSASRDEFYLAFVGKSAPQMKAFWARLIFTGRGRPPRTVKTTAELIAALRGNPNAIGYLDAAQADPALKVLLK
jgi:ABC-type phosphate transport system substrate-binding protein